MENESMFRLLFERSADAITLLDPQTGAFLDVNDASVRVTGAPDKAALLRGGPELISPERQPDGSLSTDKVKAVIRLAFEQGSHRFEWMLNRFDGSELPVEVVLTPIHSGGRPLLLSVARDITERKRAEAGMRASQQLIVSIVDNISEAIYRTGPDHELIFANRAYLWMSGYDSLEELRHVPREKLYANAADRARLLELLARDGLFRNQEIEYIRRDGRHWWGLTNSHAIRDEQTGKVRYHVGSVADITERKKAADEIQKLNASLERRIAGRTAELSASEARLRTLVEHAPEAITVFDGETGRFVSGNANACQIYGRSAEELANLTPVDVSPEFQADGRHSAVVAREKIDEALAGGTPVFEWIHRHSSGRLIPTEVRLVRLPSEGNNLLRASIIDNTEHKRIEKQLRLRSEQMQKHRDVLLKLARADKSDFDKALRKITALSASTLEVERVSYWSLQEQDSALVCELLYLNSSQGGDEKFKGTRLGAADAPTYFSALALKRPIVASDVLTHSAMTGLIAGYLNPLGITSLLDVPVWVRGEVVGVICHEQVGPAREWSAEEIDFASSLAAMISLALEESSRARSEQLLRQSEEKFKALFALSPLGMARVSWDGRFLQVNDSFARIVGRLPEEVLTLSYWDVTPREYEAQELAVLNILQKTGRFGPYEKEYLHSAGHRVPIVINGMLVKSREGTDEIWGIVEDITQRKQAERALRESEQKFRALFESSDQGVMLHDEKQFLEVNPAAVRIMGYSKQEELIGKHPIDTSPPTQPNGERSDVLARKYIVECMTEGSARFEWVVRHAGGRDIPLEVVLTRVEWNGRQIIQAFITDISERKRAEAELLKSLAREKELGQFKSNFVSMVSHEFRTPLGIIQSSAEILRDYFERLEADERREQLQSIVNNTRRMAEMMEEILALSRLDAGKMIFKPEPFDLASFCRRAVDEVLSATNRKCAIELSLASILPEALGDERLLGHVFTNLLNNAVKYSEPGATIHFAVERDAGDAVCIIRDPGIGIPSNDQQWLFNAFQRGANVGDRPGTGLGLVLVQRSAELHRGSVRIESKVGEGTQVTVRLPMFEKLS
jgi:PAS domain S-box-containing protein